MTSLKPELTEESPSQTAGPYVHIGCCPNFIGLDQIYASDAGSKMISESTPGQLITITGRIFDGAGDLLKDGLVEIWQADSSGQYSQEVIGEIDAHFCGWGRCPTDLETGEYLFETVKPGSTANDSGLIQAPHIDVWIVARGINSGLLTRLYFPDEEEANDLDAILNAVQPHHRIETLIAKNVADSHYQFDIYLQGERETVFFDL
ncbi:MAG: protocatechuate 3,4-dioxygenase alpha subunit [Gammaproteobacteria bacterium]